jgi:phospholipid transport system transporter-binding protein
MNDIGGIRLLPDGSAAISGSLTFETVAGIYRRADSLFRESGHPATIDLAAVTTVDSAALALLLEWQANRLAEQSQLRIINAPDGLLSLARLADSVELLQLGGRPVPA